MGGVAIKPVDCKDYTTAKAIKTDIELYLNSSQEVTENMISWGWFSFLLYLFAGWI